MKYTSEIERRRSFAIISHPDAGKTTLTEKFLLFGGAIQVAGAVKSNKIKKHATSDFMEIERQRGARLGQWLEGTARIARRTVNFCFCSCDLVCGGEIVLVASGDFKVPDIDKIPADRREHALKKFA